VAGVAGALLGMGFSEEEAKYYEGEFQSGRVLVAVKAGERRAAAEQVFREFGAHVNEPLVV
jgi:hypothetical protein